MQFISLIFYFRKFSRSNLFISFIHEVIHLHIHINLHIHIHHIALIIFRNYFSDFLHLFKFRNKHCYSGEVFLHLMFTIVSLKAFSVIFLFVIYFKFLFIIF